MTLLEITVVLAVLLSLCAIMMIGVRAWKNGTDRAGCVLQMRNVQLAVRSYQNIYGYAPGGMPYAAGGTQDIGNHLEAKEYISATMNQAIHGVVACGGGGTYSCEHPEVFPLPGDLYIRCSLASALRHAPDSSADW